MSKALKDIKEYLKNECSIFENQIEKVNKAEEVARIIKRCTSVLKDRGSLSMCFKEMYSGETIGSLEITQEDYSNIANIIYKEVESKYVLGFEFINKIKRELKVTKEIAIELVTPYLKYDYCWSEINWEWKK